MPDQLIVRRDKGKIWSHIRKKWIVETPEETVRQALIFGSKNPKEKS